MSHHSAFDFGIQFEDIARAAREFGERMKEMAPDAAGACGFDPSWSVGPDKDERPHHQNAPYFYPPFNVYNAEDRSLVLEFALAGFDQDQVSIFFQGDFLVLTAKASPRDENVRYIRHWFRPRDIDRQKYRVPADDYVQDLAKALFKNGVLTVTVPAKDDEANGIKIEIVKEGN
jgi:HSP20 family molecular chaperone IbpA